MDGCKSLTMTTLVNVHGMVIEAEVFVQFNTKVSARHHHFYLLSFDGETGLSGCFEGPKSSSLVFLDVKRHLKEKVIITLCSKIGYGMLIGRERVIVVIIEQCEDGNVMCISEIEGKGGWTFTVLCVECVKKWTEYPFWVHRE